MKASVLPHPFLPAVVTFIVALVVVRVTLTGPVVASMVCMTSVVPGGAVVVCKQDSQFKKNPQSSRSITAAV